MRGRSIRPQQLPLQSPQRAMSPMIQMQPVQQQSIQTSEITNLKCSQVLMGLEIQRLNQVLIDMEKKKQIKIHQFQEQENILLLEIQQQREANTELQSKEKELRDRLSIKLQQSNKQEKEVKDLQHLVRKLQSENELLDQKVSYLLNLNQYSQGAQQDIPRDTGHFLDDQEELLNLNQQISQLKTSLINGKQGSRVHIKYANLAEMHLELVQAHINAIKRLPDIRDVEIQQMQVYLTTLNKDLEALRRYETPVAVRRILNNQSPGMNRSLSPSMSSDEVFMKILGHIEHLQKDSQNIPTIIKQISLLNQLVRLKNEDLKLQGHKKTIVTHSPMKYSAGKQISPIRFSPIRVSPVRVSPTRYGVSAFSIPQRISIYPQRVLFESHPISTQHQRQERHSQPARQQTEGQQIEESQALDQHQGFDLLLRQKSVHIQELTEQLKQLQNDITFENNRVTQLTNEIQLKNDEINQLKKMIDQRIDDQTIKQELDRLRQKLEITNQEKYSIEVSYQKLQQLYQEALQTMQEQANSQKNIQQQEAEYEIKRSVSQYEKEISDLTRQLNVANSQNKKLQEMQEQNQQQINNLIVQLAQIQQDYPEIQVEVPQLQEQTNLEKLEKELQNQQKIIDQLTKKNQELESKQKEPENNIISLLEDKLKEQEGKEQQLLAQLKTIEERKNSDVENLLQQKILQFNTQMEENQQRLSDKEKECKELQDLGSNLKKIIENQQKDLKDSQDQTKQQELQVNQAQQQVQLWKGNYDQIVKQQKEEDPHSLQSKLVEESAKVANLNSELQQAKHQIEILDAQQAKQSDENKGLQKQVDHWKQKYQEAMDQFTKQSSPTSVQNQLVQTTKQLHDAQEQVTQLEHQLEQVPKLEESVQTLKKDLKDSQDQTKQQELQVNQAQQQVQLWKGNYDQIVKQQKEEDPHSLQSKLVEESAKVANLNSELQQAKHQNEILDAQQAKQSDENKGLQKQVDHWKQKYQEAMDQFTKQSSPTSVQNQLVQTTKQLHDAQEQVTQLEHQLEQVPKLEESVQTLKKDLKDSQDQTKQQELQVNQAQQQVQLWKGNYDQIVKQQKEEDPHSLQSKLVEESAKVANLNSELQQAKHQNEILDAQQAKQSDENKGLQKQVDHWKQKYQEAMDQFTKQSSPTSVQNQLVQTTKQLHDAQEQVTQLEHQLEQVPKLEESVQTLKKDLKDSQDQTKQQELQVNQAQQQVQLWKGNYDQIVKQQKEEDPHSLQSKLVEESAKVANLNSELQQAKHQNEILDAQQAKQSDENKGLQKQVDHWKQKYQEAMDQFTKQSSPTSVQNQLVQTTKQLHDAQKQVTQLEHQLEQVPKLEESVQTLKKDLKDSQDETKQQELQVNQAQQQVQLWKGNYDQIVKQQKEEDPHSLQSKLVEESAKVANLNSELQQAKHQIEILDAQQAKQSDENKGLQKQVDHWKQKYQEAMDQFTKQSSPTSVQNQLVQTTKQLHDAQEQVTQLEHQLEQVPKLEESVQTLKKDLKDSQDQTKQQELQVNQAQQQVQLWKGNYDQIVKQQKEEDPHSLQSKLVEESAKVANLNSELQQAKHQNEILDAQQAKQSDENKGLQKQVDHWKQKYQEAMDQFTKQSSPTSVQNQLVQTTKQLHDAQEQVTQLEHQLEQVPKLVESVQTLKKDLKDSQDQTKQQELQVNQAQQQVQLWKGNYDQIVKQQKEEDPHSLQSKLVEESAKVANLNSELQKAKHQIEILDAQQAKQSDENKGLQKQVDHWKQKYQEAMDQFTKQSSPTSVQNQLVQTTKQLHETQNQLLQMEHQNEQIPQLTSQIEDLTKEVEKQKIQQLELQALKGQLDKSEKDLIESQQQTSNTLSKLHQVQQELIQLQSQSQDGAKTSTYPPIQFGQDAEKQLAINQLEQKVQNLNEQINQLQAQLKINSEAYKEALGEKGGSDATTQIMENNRILLNDNTQIKNQLTEAQQQLIKSQNEITKLNRAILDMQKGTQAEILQQELKAKDHEIQTYQAQIDHWKQKYQQALDQFSQQSSPSGLQQQVIQATQNIHQLEEQLQIQQIELQQIAKLKSQIAQLEQMVSHGNQEVEFWKKKYNELVESHTKSEDPSQLQMIVVEKMKLEQQIQEFKQNTEKQQNEFEQKIVQETQEITIKLEDARRVLKLQESQITLLNQENSMLKNNIQQFQGQKQEIQLQKSQLSQLEFWKQKYAELLEQVKPEQASEIIKEHEKQSEEQLQKLKEQSEEIQTDDQEMTLLQQQIQELQNNNSQLRQAIVQNNEEKLSLQQQIKEVQNELNQALTKLIEFQESSGPQQERQMKFEKDPELLATISKLEQQNQTLQQHVTEVEEQRKKDQERFSNIIGQGVNEQQIVSLLEENQSLQTNARKLAQKLEQEQHQTISLQSQIMNLNKKILELSDSSKLQQLQEEINQQKTESLKTQQQIDHWKNKYQEVLEQFSKEASPKSLQNQLAIAVQRTHELEEEVKLKQVQLDTELPQLQAKILELQQALQQSKKEGILWNEKYDDLVKKKESIQTTQDQSQALEEAKKEAGFWKEKYDQLLQMQSEATSPQSINAKLLEQIDKSNQLELQVNELQKKLIISEQQTQQPQTEQNLLEEITYLTNQNKQQLESFTQTTEILNQQLQTYQQTVSNQNKEIAEFKNKLIEMQAEKQGASEFWKSKYAELLEQVKPEQASEIIKEHEKQSEEQLQKLKEQSEEIQTDDQEMTLLQQQIQELQNNNSQLRQAIAQNNEEKLSLQQQIKEVQNELNQALTKLNEFQESSGPQQERQMKFEKDPELLATISKLEQQNQTLQQHVTEVEEQRKKDQERFSNIIGQGVNEQQIVSLLEENQSLQTNARKLAQKLEQEQHQTISLQSQIMNLNKKILELSDSSKLQQLQEEINQQKTESLKTQQQIDHWKNKYQEVLEQFSKEASPKSLQNQLAIAVQRTHELEEEVKLKQVQLDTELPQLQAKILELQQALQQSKKEGILWNEKYDDLVKKKESIQTTQDQSQALEEAKKEAGFWKEKYDQLLQMQSEATSPQSINAKLLEQIDKSNQLELQVNELQKKLIISEQQTQQPQTEQNLLEEITYLTNQNKQQLESFTQTTEILNQQLQTYQQTVSNQNKEIAEFKNKLIEMQAEKQGASEFWKSKYAELLEQVKPEQALEIIKEHEKQSEEQLQKLKEQSEEIQTDDQEMTLLQQQIQELQNNNSQLRQAIAQNNEEKLSLQQQIKEVQNELNQALTKLIEFQESSGPQQERQMKFEKDPELLATISKLEQQNQTLQQHVTEVEEQRKKDQERFSNIIGQGVNEQQIVSLLEENQSLQTNARKLAQKLEQEQHQTISLQSQIMNLNKKILELSDSSKLQQLQEEINQQKTESLKTQQQIDHWKNKYQEVLEQFSKEASPKSLQNQLAIAVQRTHELEEEVKLKQVQLDTELPQLQAKILELQQALQQSKKEGILWNEKYDDLVKKKESIQTTQDQSQALEEAKKEAGFWKEKYDQLLQMQSEATSPQSINAKLLEQIDKSNQLELQVNELQKKLILSEQQTQQPQTEQNLLEEITYLTNQNKQQLESFTQTTEILNQQLQTYQQTVSNQNKEIAEFKNKLIEMQAEKQGASEFWKSKYAELLEQVKPEQASEIIKEHEKQSEEQLQKLKEQSEEIQTDQQQIQELQNNNSQLRQAIAQNNEEKLSLQQQIKEVQNELNQALTKLNEFQESSGPQQERQMKFEKDPELLATISKLEQQNQTLQQHVTEVEEQRKKDQERFSNIIGQGVNEQQIVSLLEENQSLQTNARKLTQKLEQEQHQTISLQSQIMNLNKKILELSDSSKLQQLQEEINQQKTESLKTQQQIDHWKNKYQEVLEQFSKEASPKSLQNQLAIAVQRTHELEEEVKLKQVQLDTELPQLQAKILELQQALQQSKKEGILWNEKYDDLVKKKESIQTTQDQSQALEEAKKEAGFWKEKYDQLLQMQSEATSPQSINAKLLEYIDKSNQLELQVNELQKKLIISEQQTQQPQTEQNLLEEINTLRQQVQLYSTQINTLTQVTETNQKEIDYLTKENTTLKNDSQYIRGNFWKQKYYDLLITNDPNTAKEMISQAEEEQRVEQTGDQNQELKQQITQLEEYNKGLQKQVDHWKQKYQEAMDQFTKQSSPTSVQNQLVQTTKQLHDAQEQVTQLEHQLEQVPKLEESVQTLKKDLKDSQDQTKQQELQVNQAQQQVQLWKGNYDQIVKQQKEEDPHSLQSKLVEESAKVANLNSELQQAKHQNEILDAQQAKQSDENKGLQKQVDHWKQKYQEAMDQFTKQSSPTSVQNQLVQTTKQLHDAQEQVTQLEHQLEQVPKLEESVQTLKKDLKDSQDQTKQQELQVNQAQQQVQLWKGNYDQIVKQQKEEDPHSLQSKLVEESAKVANLNSELQQAKHQNEILDAQQAKQSDENKGLQKQVDHWKQKYQEAMDQFTKQSSPTSVQNQLVQTTKQLHDAQEQVTQLEHQLEQVPKLEESVQTLKKDLKDSQDQTKQQELQVNQAQQQVQLWKGNYDQIVKQQKEEDPHSLQSKLVEESAKVANLNSELQQAKHQNEILDAQQAKQSDENKGLQKQVDHWKQKYQEAMDQFTKQSSPTSVQNQLVQTTKQLHDAQKQVTQLEHQLEQVPKLEESVQTLKKDLKDSQDETKQQELQVNQAQQQVQLWKGNYDQIVKQQKEEDPHSLQSKLVEESAKVANLNSELQKAKHQIEILDAQQAKQSDENKGLQKQVDHWKQKYQEAMDQFAKQSSPTSVQNQLVQTTKQLHETQNQLLQMEHQNEQIPQLTSQIEDLTKEVEKQKIQQLELQALKGQLDKSEKDLIESQQQTSNTLSKLHQVQQELIQLQSQSQDGAKTSTYPPIQFGQDAEKQLAINQLEQKVQNLNEQINQLQAQLKINSEAYKEALGEKGGSDATTQIMENNRILLNDNTQIKNQLTEAQQQLIKSQNEITKLNRAILDMQKGTQAEILQQELKAKDHEIQTYQAQIDHWKQKYQQALDQFSQQSSPSGLQQQVIQATQNIHQLEEQLQIQQIELQQIAKLKSQIAQLEQMVSHGNQEVEFWKKKYESVIAERQKQQTASSGDISEQINKLIQQKAEADDHINRLTKQNEELQKVIKNEFDSDELANQLADQQKEINKLHQQISIEQGRSSSTQPGDINLQNLIEVTRKNNELEKDIQAKQKIIQEFKETLQKTQEELNELKNQDERIKSEFWRNKYEEVIKAQVVGQSEENNRLKQDKLELQQEINELQSKLIQIQESQIVQPGSRRESETNILSNYKKLESENEKLKKQVDDLAKLNENIMNQMKQALSGGVNEQKLSQLLENNQNLEKKNNDLIDQQIESQKKIKELQQQISVLNQRIIDLEDPSVAEQTQIRVSDMEKQLELIGQQVAFWKDKHQQVLDEYSKQLSPTNAQQKMITQAQRISELEETLSIFQKQYDQEKQGNEQIISQLQMQIKYLNDESAKSIKKFYDQQQRESILEQDSQNNLIQFWKSKYEEALMKYESNTQVVRQNLQLSELQAQQIGNPQAFQVQDQLDKLRNENQQLINDITFYKDKITALEQISKNFTQEDGSQTQQDTIIAQQQIIGKLESKLKLAQEESTYWNQKYKDLAQENIEKEMGNQPSSDYQQSASYWRQKYDEGQRQYEQEKLVLLQQLEEKEEQLEQHMQSFQSILKDELKEELTRLKQKEEQDRQEYEQGIQQQILQQQRDMDNSRIQKLQQEHEKEKEKLIKEFLARIDSLLQSNVQKYPEGENWKELILKYEKQRQNELYELRQQLEILQRSYITSQDVEFFAERRAYENKINELKSRIIQDDPQDLYDTIEYQRNQIMDLQDQVHYLQNERTQLEMRVISLNQQIDGLRENLSRFQQQSDQRRRVRAEVIEAIEEMKRDRERGDRDRERERERDSYRSPYRQTRYSHKSSWERERQPRDYLRQSNQQYSSPIQMMQQQQSNVENKEIAHKLQELDEVKHKYQTALNNILRLEAQVIDKLQQDDVLIE